MKLPPHTFVEPGAIDEILTRHGLTSGTVKRLPDIGIINAIYRICEEYVLRVPRNHAAHIAQTRAEVIAAPAARAAGVRTPPLLAWDDSCELLPVPYSIFRWVPGRSLESLDLDPGETAAAWREVGHDLALLHTRIANTGPVAALAAAEAIPDPRELLETRATEAWFTSLETRWLSRWLHRLAPAATVAVPPRLLHNDVQGTNIIVAPGTHDYVALLDWGCAGWGDPACDIGGPLRAAPHILAGYREVAPLDQDHSAEARILWRHIQMVLYVLPRGATPGLSWVEHPTARLLEISRFFFDKPGGAWADLRP